MRRTFLVQIFPKEDFNFESFDEHMRSYNHWARIKKDLWMVTYNGNAAQLRDNIAHATDKKCEVLALNISNSGWATLNIARNLTDWMSEYV